MRHPFLKGHVVKWNGGLWIVGGVSDHALTLIDFSRSNSTAFPSKTWPMKIVHEDHCDIFQDGDFCCCDPVKEVDTDRNVYSVVFVADSVRAFIDQKIQNLFYGDDL